MKFDAKRTIKFIAKCAACLLPLVAMCAFTILAPMCYMDEEYPSWRYVKEVAEGKVGEEYYDTVILGDSVAKSSIIPNELGGGSCVSLAVGGANASDMYYTFREYLRNHEAPKNVIIMFGPFHYWHVDNYKTRSVYFKSLSLEDAKSLYEAARQFGSESVMFDDFMVYELSCRLGLPTVYLPAINAAHFIGRYGDNKAIYEEVKSQNGYSVFGNLDYCDELSYEAAYTEMELDGDAVMIMNYFGSLVKMCDSKDIKVNYIQAALNETTFDSMNEVYLGQYYSIANSLKELGGDVYYEDYLRRYDNEYFGDASHLNKKGAAKFTAEVSELLQAAGRL